MRVRRRLSQTAVLLALSWALCQPAVPRQDATRQEEIELARGDIQAVEAIGGRRPGRGQGPRRPDSYAEKQSASRRRGSRPGRREQLAQSQTSKGDERRFPVGQPPKGKIYLTLGVTIWRVRPASEAGGAARKAPRERMTLDNAEREFVVTRLSDSEPLAENDLIQISVEYLPKVDGEDASPAASPVYLYVVNREQFGASLKKPRLIFPTRATYEGDNRLFPGQTVTLPDPTRPFRIKRGGDGGRAQAFETYTLILSPVRLNTELPGELSQRAMELQPELVSGWERRWSADVARADLKGWLGRAREERELRASGNIYEVRSTQDTAEDLTQDDPPPQTIFRRVAQPGAALLVTLRLPFKDSGPRP